MSKEPKATNESKMASKSLMSAMDTVAAQERAALEVESRKQKLRGGLLNETSSVPFLSVPTDDSKYTYVFLHDPARRTARGLPVWIGHKLINAETGATLVQGSGFPVPSSWEIADLQTKFLKLLKEGSARMFFKTVARKPDLWKAWEYHDHDALFEDAPRYVYMEQVIRRFVTDVLGKPYARRTPGEGQGYYHKVCCTEKIRGNYKGLTIHVSRELRLFCPSSNLVTLKAMRVSCEFSAPHYIGLANRNNARLSLSFEYPIERWPSLVKFLAEPRVEAVLDAWIANVWTDEQREAAKVPNDLPPAATFADKDLPDA